MMYRNIRCYFLALESLALICGLLYSSASAMAQTLSPKTTITLASATSFMQGEPIILKYNMQNKSDQILVSNFGRLNDKWYSLKLVDENGKSATPKKILDSEASSGFKVIRYRSSMASGETRSDTIVATQHFDIPHPGKWTLTATVQMSVAVVEPNEARSGYNPSALLKDAKPSPEQEFKFDLTVLPPRTSYLRAVAEKLRDTIFTEKDQKHRLSALTALTSMPEEAVWRTWEELAKNPPESYGPQIAVALGRVPSKHTAEILANMHWNPVISHSGYSIPGIALFRMQEQVDGELKAYIDSLFRRNKNSPYTIRLPSN